MTPFALTSPSQYRVAAPPALTSPQYWADFNEVKALGAFSGSTRTAEQTTIASFWAQATHVPINEIARALSAQKGLTIDQNGYLFAILNIALADSRVAIWDSKYFHNAWRADHRDQPDPRCRSRQGTRGRPTAGPTRRAQKGETPKPRTGRPVMPPRMRRPYRKRAQVERRRPGWRSQLGSLSRDSQSPRIPERPQRNRRRGHQGAGDVLWRRGVVRRSL